MKKIPFYIFTLLVLCSCVTLETHIENKDAYYAPIAITIPENTLFTFDAFGIHIHPEVFNKHFEKKTIIMNDYFLREDSTISNLPPEGSSGFYVTSVRGRYSFYKRALCLAQFEIVTESTLFIFTNGSSIGTSKRYIRTIDSNGTILKEIILDAPNSDSYMQVQDELLGTIVMGKYESRSEHQAPDSLWKYHTGFTIWINAEEYGIIALYKKPKVYLKTSYHDALDEKAKDQMVLYIFMVYESFNRP
jgi:hypothetical protein